MLSEFEAVTILGVLEFDGLIRVESGVLRTTHRFQSSLQAARRAQRAKNNLALKDHIARAMHGLYGKYLSESEMLTLVEAMLPIAEAEGPEPRPRSVRPPKPRRQA